MRRILGLFTLALAPAILFASLNSDSGQVDTQQAAAAESSTPDQLAAVDDNAATTSSLGLPGSATSLFDNTNDGTVAAIEDGFVSSANGVTGLDAINSVLFSPIIGSNTGTSTSPFGATPSSIVNSGSTGGSTAGATNTSSGPTFGPTVTASSPTFGPTATTVNSSPNTTRPTTATTNRPTNTTAKPTTTAKPATTAKPTTTVGSTGGRTLVFSEEFNSLDTSRWSPEFSTYGDGNNELQCYLSSNVAVSNGKLKLTAKKETAACPGSTRQYSSGMVRSNGFTFSPGQSIEYRVKLTPNDDNNQGGLWPAFWSSSWHSRGSGWPQRGEWDGFEVMTARSFYRSVYSIHYQNTQGQHDKKNKEIFTNDKFSDSWHTMRFDYGFNGELTWYFDGAIVQEIPSASRPAPETSLGWPAPFDEAMKEFKINLALGGNPGPLDDRALPATYEVDYVRIYDMN